MILASKGGLLNIYYYQLLLLLLLFVLIYVIEIIYEVAESRMATFHSMMCRDRANRSQHVFKKAHI